MIISLIIVSISIYYIVLDLIDNKETSNSIDKLIEEVTIKDETEETLIDWSKIKNINKDIIAWIKIDGTNIDYPILKNNEDNLYYINHTYKNDYNPNGSLFTLDKKAFNILETTVYGHNRKNGIMFGKLVNYLREDFFDSHRVIKIYTSEKDYTARIFSVYVERESTDKNNIELLSIKDKIEYYKQKSKYFVDDIKEYNSIIKLVTCYYDNIGSFKTTKRCFVIANLESGKDR